MKRAPFAITALLVASSFAPAAAPQQVGPQNPAQAREVNALRLKLLAPANGLYGAAMTHCADTQPDRELIDALAQLAGATHTFGIVPIDYRRYAEKPAFRSHVDRSFERLRDAVEAVRVRRASGHGWKPLEGHWQRLVVPFERIAFIWSKRNKLEKRIREVVLTCPSALVRPGEPVQLDVFIGYTDGSRIRAAAADLAWMIAPREDVSIDGQCRFVAQAPGVYRIQAAYRELMSQGCVVRVIRAPKQRKSDR